MTLSDWLYECPFPDLFNAKLFAVDEGKNYESTVLKDEGGGSLGTSEECMSVLFTK